MAVLPKLYAYDFESIDVDGTSKALDTIKRATAYQVSIRLEDAPARYRKDGGDPTVDGTIFYPAESDTLEGDEINNFRITKAGTVNATLKVEFRKRRV